MTRLEQSGQEIPQRSEPTLWRPDQEMRSSGIEGREVQESPTNHLGFKDRPCREFREQYDSEYIEPPTRPLRIESFDNPRETVTQVNPEYGRSPDATYRKNCADCARSYERTWRGQREEAAGRAATLDGNGKLIVNGESDIRTENWAGERFTHTEDVAAIKARLEAGGHGTSAIVASNFENGGVKGGHAYNLVNHNGEICVVDAQLGKVYPFDDQTIHPVFEKSSRHRVMMWDHEGKRVF